MSQTVHISSNSSYVIIFPLGLSISLTPVDQDQISLWVLGSAEYVRTNATVWTWTVVTIQILYPVCLFPSQVPEMKLKYQNQEIVLFFKNRKKLSCIRLMWKEKFEVWFAEIQEVGYEWEAR